MKSSEEVDEAIDSTFCLGLFVTCSSGWVFAIVGILLVFFLINNYISGRWPLAPVVGAQELRRVLTFDQVLCFLSLESTCATVTVKCEDWNLELYQVSSTETKKRQLYLDDMYPTSVAGALNAI